MTANVSVSFEGVTISAIQAEKWGYNIQANVKRLLTGKFHVQLSSYAPTFPRSFACYTDDENEISAIGAKVGIFGTLYINSVRYDNIYISELKDIHEVILDSGKFTYQITFSIADSH